MSLFLFSSFVNGQSITTSDPKYDNIVEEGVLISHIFSFSVSGAGCTITGETSKATGVPIPLPSNTNIVTLPVTWNHANTATITFHVTGCTATPSPNGDYSKNYPILNIPDNISGSTNVSCGTQNVTYSVPSVANANSYEWSYPSGWTVSGSSTSNSINLQTNINGSGNVNVKAVNGDLRTSSNTISVSRPTVSSSAPSITSFGSGQGTLTSVTLLCSSTNFTNSSVADAEEYRWVATGGISVGGSSSATVTGTTSPTISATSDGTIAVQAYSNSCQNGSNSVPYTIVYGTPNAPSTTLNGSSFSGSGSICRNTSQLLAGSDSRATSIVWSIITGSNVNLYTQSSFSATINPQNTGFIGISASATNCFGSSSSSLYFTINNCGGFRMASNPATTNITLIKTDDSDEVDDSTPEKISLLNTKGIEVRTANVKEMIKKKQLKDGNKLEFDVSELARGDYYLHTYTPNHPNKDKQSEKLKVILQ